MISSAFSSSQLTAEIQSAAGFGPTGIWPAIAPAPRSKKFHSANGMSPAWRMMDAQMRNE